MNGGPLDLDSLDPTIKTLLPGYLENRKAELPKIKQFIADGDFENLRIIAHNLKGSGSSYCLTNISDIGGKLEQAALDKDAELAARLNAELEKVVTKLIAQIAAS